MRKTKTPALLLWLSLLVTALLCVRLPGQTPFQRKAVLYQIMENTNQLAITQATPNYNTVLTDAIYALPVPMNAMGFRKQDNLLYAVATSDHHIYRLGDNATYLDLGDAGLDNTLAYNAGDVSPDGKYLTVIGSDLNTYMDVQLARINLEMLPLTSEKVVISAGTSIKDIAYDFNTGTLYGVDDYSEKLMKIDFSVGTLTPSPIQISYENHILTMYFDPFGDLHGYGRAVNGIVDGIFVFDKGTGKEKLLATGPTEYIGDGAGCPYAIAIKNIYDPAVILPCSPFVSNYLIANGSGEAISNVDFAHELPPEFHLTGIISNPLGVLADTLSVPGTIAFHQFTVYPGVKTVSLKMGAGDIPKGNYRTQSKVLQLPQLYGTEVLADDPATGGNPDSVTLKINRFEEDTINYRWLICYGEVQPLDGTQFGSQILWNTGSTLPIINVTSTGNYSLKAGNTCEFVVAEHEVTAASCPFTIEVDHKIIPKDTFYPCSDVIFRFILRNDSGEDRFNITFTDTLPQGFSLTNIASNPFGGNLEMGTVSNVVTINNMLLPFGNDTLDLLVHAGNVSPGRYKNRGIIKNIPLLMGPFRLSDNPFTPVFDSTAMQIIGALSDTTLEINQKMCANNAITLDATDLGATFLWEDGSTAPKLTVNALGDYKLTILDGCEPFDVIWHVVDGGGILISPTGPFTIHQGEQIQIKPNYSIAGGDTLAFVWTDPMATSLSCLYCPATLAAPVENTLYSFFISNGICEDSIPVSILVDKTRRIYTGNIFSPDDDGVNDYFFLQSPDSGQILNFSISDRWGNMIFQSRQSAFNEAKTGWNGEFNGQTVPSGVYIWWAEIEFPDGERKVLKGDVTVAR